MIAVSEVSVAEGMRGSGAGCAMSDPSAAYFVGGCMRRTVARKVARADKRG